MAETTSIGPANSFVRQLQKIDALPLPQGARRKIISFAAGRMVPYLQTSSVLIEEVRGDQATLSLRNLRHVQNHMKSVHACAMFLLAEAATGTLLMANLPDRSLFSTTHIEIDYTKRAVGDLRAVARLTPEQQTLVREQPKGKLTIPVTVTDQQGNSPATFVVEWSWKHRTAA